MSERVLIVPIATNEWWASLVRWFLRSKFNHIFILFEDNTLGGWWSVDIRNDGAHIVPAERSSLSRIKQAEFYEHAESFLPALQMSRGIVGSGYDWFGLAVNVARKLLYRWFGVEWLKPLHDPDRNTCAEWIMEILIGKNVEGVEQLEQSIVDPGEIRNFMHDSIEIRSVDNPVF